MSDHSFQSMHQEAKERLAYWVEGASLSFTEELCRLMADQNLSRSDLAERLGVSPAYITKVLSGSGNFTLTTMTKLARGVGADLRFHLAPEETVTRSVDVPRSQLRQAQLWSRLTSNRSAAVTVAPPGFTPAPGVLAVNKVEVPPVQGNKNDSLDIAA